VCMINAKPISYANGKYPYVEARARVIEARAQVRNGQIARNEAVMRDFDDGMSIDDVCALHGISEDLFFKLVAVSKRRTKP